MVWVRRDIYRLSSLISLTKAGLNTFIVKKFFLVSNRNIYSLCLKPLDCGSVTTGPGKKCFSISFINPYVNTDRLL